VGSAAELAMRQKGFATEPSQHVSVSDAVIDVAASGDMAVYRATYSFAGIDPKTRKPISESGNYLAGYRLQPDGSWKINWSVISDTAPAPAAAG
jgi:ketosteroid isomerase-like protein